MIDPNEAPEGYVAKPEKNGCLGCAFRGKFKCKLSGCLCYPSQRKDGESVIFIHREESKSEAESTNHAINALTIELADLIKKNEELENKVSSQKNRIRYLEGATNHATGTPLSKAKDEAAQWKRSHDHVCKQLAACEDARDHNAELWQEQKDKASKWQSACLERDELIAKLKAQLTAALESIARMR